MAILVMAILVPVTFAAGDAALPPEAPSEFFTWSMLGTYAGALAATLLFTQLLKGIWFASWPTQTLSYVIALITLLGADWASGSLTVDTGFLCVFNAGIVCLAANGGYNTIKAVKKTDNEG
jgi:hypothetical protein